MSDHDFERQVKQQMDELRFRPTADVWKGVEMELDKDKKRRRLIYWWPAALLLLIGCGYLFYRSNGTAQQEPSLTRVEQAHDATSPLSHRDMPAAGSAQSQANEHRGTSGTGSLVIAPNESTASNNRSSSPSSKTIALHDQKSALNNRPSSSVTAADNVSKNNQREPLTAPENERYNRERNNYSVAGSSKSVNSISSDHSFRAGISTMPFGLGIHTGLNVVSNHASTLALNSQVVAVADKKKSSSKRWSFGVTAQAGMSGTNTGGVFNFQRASVVDVSGGILNSAFLPANTVIYNSSMIKPRTGFTLGGFVQRSVSKRLNVSAGLSFNRFNQSVMVGRKMYNSVQLNADRLGLYSAYPYYTRDAKVKYAVHYDFIDLPIRVQYNVNPSSKVPVSVNAGIVTSRLVGSNAVHFDGSSAGYFKNNALLNQWQVGATTGLAVTVMNKSSHPLTIGPSFRYQVSNTLSKQVGASRHIVGVGLEVRVRIK